MTRSQRSVPSAVTAALRAAIAAVFLEGCRERNPGAVANAAVAFALTYLPDAVEARFDVAFRPWQRAYGEAGLLAHAAGMLGPYEDVWWWDHVTHVHSATLLGALVRVVARRRGRDPAPYVLGVVVGGGVAWELLEYAVHAVSSRLGLDPVLVPYGPVDTALDLGFDLAGALLAVAVPARLLENLERPADADDRPSPSSRRSSRAD